jgi:deazaflavin-dependent oxidoreductase (nitroreductase family)
MALLHTLSARVASSRPGAAVFSRVLPVLDGAVARLTGGRRSFSELAGGVEVVRLTTTGARSGLARTVPLLALPDGDALVVVASNWGSARPPAWSANLAATPGAAVERRGVSRDVIARTASLAERDRLWPLLDAMYPGYRAYRLRAGREIPLLVLEPR